MRFLVVFGSHVHGHIEGGLIESLSFGGQRFVRAWGKIEFFEFGLCSKVGCFFQGRGLLADRMI